MKALNKTGKVIIYILLWFWVVVEVYPILYMYISSMKTESEIMMSPFSLPSKIDFTNLISVWNGGKIGTKFSVYFLNSVIITVGTLLILCVVSAMCGYALSRYKFIGSKIIFLVFTALIAIPIHALIIPIYNMAGNWGMLSNRFFVIIVYASVNLPFSIVLMRTYFESVPKTVEEAARIDGCTELSVFRKIAIPMSKSAIATVMIVNVVSIWSELMFATVLLQNPEVRTLPVGINLFASGMYSSSVGLLMASLALSTTPLLVVYFIFQKQIMQGMAEGSLK